MAKLFETYAPLIVESYIPTRTAGLHGPVHIRPVDGQGVSTSLRVECSKDMMDPRKHPVGTKFRIQAKLTDRQGSGDFLYTYHGWKFEVLEKPSA